MPDAGRVYFSGRDITETPPYRRNTGMVFQNYALWPHMTVFENVAYGLRVRGVAREEISRRVSEALEMVRMSAERDRYPNQLSGGQQQRVALARALVIKPDCLLLDEPLSNLDAKLRLEMRSEIRRIHSEATVTTVYVTHDQKEALSMADRLAVLREGRVIQIGSPGEVYRRPANEFVAAFIGETNLVRGTVRAREGEYVVADTQLGVVAGMPAAGARLAQGDACVASIRPEDIAIAEGGASRNCFGGEVIQYTFLGETGQVVYRAGGQELRALVPAPRADYRSSAVERLRVAEEKVVIFDGPRATSGGGE